MRKALICVAAVGVILAGVIAANALAFTITVRAGNLKGTFGAIPSPKTLPKKKRASFGVTIFGKVQTTDGTHPSALREAVVEDGNVAVNAKGVPICRGDQLEARNTGAAKRACGSAIVGRGSASVEIAFPEQKPITVVSPLLLFNGGSKGPKTTLYVHAFITVPAPAAVVTAITVKKVHGGSYAVAKVPVIAGGSGSALGFRFKIDKKKFTYKHHKHTYLEANCPSGHFSARIVKAVFRNEAKIEGVAHETVLAGHLAVPCTPIG